MFTDVILYDNPTLVPLLNTKLDSESVSKMFHYTRERIINNIHGLSYILNKNLSTTGRLPSNVFTTEEFPSELYEKYDVEVKERHVFDYEQGKSVNVNMFPVHIDIEIK